MTEWAEERNHGTGGSGQKRFEQNMCKGSEGV